MNDPDIPTEGSIHNYLLYTLSLPERALRSTVGVAGGMVREGANLLLPQAFRSSKSYEIVVQQGLDFMTRDIAGVKLAGSENDTPQIEGYVAKKTVGGFVEMASLATLHLSPALLLAVVSDVAYGSQTYLKELSLELKREGVIAEDSTIDHASDLLEAIRESSALSAQVFDTPPLSIEGITQAIEQTTNSVSKIDPTKVLPAAEIDRLWREMHEVARGEEVTLLEVSGAMTLHTLNRLGRAGQGALSGITIAGSLFDRHVVDHYRVALTDIHSRGYYNTLAEVSQPYIAAVWENFSTEKSTITQDLLTGKLLGDATRAVSGWFGNNKEAATPAPTADTDLPVPSPEPPPPN
ncbi:hypothetical protein [Aeoliella sp. SH292]|uniref:hypothetical protein n=1 Tax=Aeoliella sp. SH292 TaxID=3454464 RepID=UPI003F95D74A